MKSGFAVLVGRSNVGKSTLMNALVGTKIAVVSPKPQTTRHIIHGVLNDERGQVVFVDTPGIFEKPLNRITDILNQRAKEAVEGIDLVIYVADPTRPIGNEEQIALRLTEPLKIKKILVINKIDLRKVPYIEEYRRLADRFINTIEVSALREQNLKALRDLIFENLPEGEMIYKENEFTNLGEEQWIAEIIREKVFIQLHQEIPYNIGVEVEHLEERKEKTGKPILYIKANILTNDARYKGMIVGKKGQKIKEMGQSARKELEIALNRRIFLELEVLVDPHWPERLL